GQSGAYGVRALGDVVVDRAGQCISRGGTTIGLTSRELAVLQSLMQRVGAVVSKETLLDEVWADEARPTTLNAVEAHVSALRRKLEELDAPILRTVHGRGYVLDGGPVRNGART